MRILDWALSIRAFILLKYLFLVCNTEKKVNLPHRSSEINSMSFVMQSNIAVRSTTKGEKQESINSLVFRTKNTKNMS